MRSIILFILLINLFLSSVYAKSIHDVIPCINGQVKPCGSSIGICEPGKRKCVNGVWGECIGGRRPDPNGEICGDGLDNDCDGEIDECSWIDMSGYFLIGSGIVLFLFALILLKLGY